MPRNVEIDDALADEIFNERMDSEFEKIKQERDDYKNKYLYAVADKENAIKRIKSQMSIAADAEKTNIVTLPVLKDMGFAVQPSMVSTKNIAFHEAFIKVPAREFGLVRSYCILHRELKTLYIIYPIHMTNLKVRIFLG